MKDAGLSAKTIRNHHAIISSALHQAARWEWVRENVADRAKPPRVSQTRMKLPPSRTSGRLSLQPRTGIPGWLHS
jgi:hypothetical protein